jgi:hypothetical protein
MEFVMSQRELHRMHVVQLTVEGRESAGGGAKLLGISTPQMKGLRRKLKERGVGGLKHGSWGKPPWNKTALEQELGLAGISNAEQATAVLNA